MAQVSRAALLFAYAAEQFVETSSLTSAYTALFAPAIAKFQSGAVFNADSVSKEMENLYGIDIHPYAVNQMAKYLEEAGLISANERSNRRVTYYYNEVEEAPLEDIEKKISDITCAFVDFARPKLARLKSHSTAHELGDALLKRLRKMEFVDLLMRPDLEYQPGRSLPSVGNSTELHIDTVCAQFILHVANKKTEDMHALVKVAEGALLAEVIDEIKKPTTNEKYVEGMSVFLDGPILLDILGLSNEKQVDYAHRLINNLKSAGAAVKTFTHCVEEVGSIIDAVISASYTNGAYGDLATRMRAEPDLKMKARLAQKSTSYLLEKFDVTVHKWAGNIDPTSIKYFTREKEEKLFENLSFISNVVTRERDAASLAHILRLRRDNEPRDFYGCKFLFITRNPRLAAQGDNALKREKLVPPYVFPACITDRHLAGLLWVVTGGQSARSLPQSKLLANSSRALAPRQDVISRMHAFVAKNDPESLERYEALLRDQRCQYVLTDQTLNDAEIINDDNYAEILESIEEALVHQLQEETSAKIDRKNEEIQREKDRAERARVLAESSESRAHKSDESKMEFVRSQFEVALSEVNSAYKCRRALGILVVYLIALGFGLGATALGNVNGLPLWGSVLLWVLLVGGLTISHFLSWIQQFVDKWLDNRRSKFDDIIQSRQLRGYKRPYPGFSSVSIQSPRV
ncbi:hypothetical protein J7355_07185 [Endozoicomonas sp. G2_2]|uniref:hypothetical protein n=1 Tax=Endozoicomonas sp. G2_2 TaxID=2821092 RepID=UPI001ADBEB1C|nr:hypothetical protein [Endozoicomonas sp. G2_2]MBO9469876.1 hypothetical protein [Endozoicomonas sp. G2_2]